MMFSWSKSRLLVIAAALSVFLVLLPSLVLAAPYYHLVIDHPVAVTGAERTLRLYLNTDGSTLTAAQGVINFSPSLLSGTRIHTLSSRCSFWAPADPSLGFGSQSTPYFRTNNKAVFSCGFSNPGYTSSSANGALIASIVFTPTASGAADLTFSNTQFRYIGDTIAPGTSPTLTLNIFDSTDSANLFIPTPTPTPTPIPPPPLPDPEPEDTLEPGDIEFVEIKPRTTANGQTITTTDDGAPIAVIDQDNSIPPPPANLPQRERPTPFLLAPDSPDSPPPSESREEGEVLSVASLRELLIPGKSSADRTVVMINLLSTLTFLVLLAIAMWRLITISRLNRVKYQHMQEMLAGELSVMQSKIGSGGGSKDMEEEIKKSFENLVDSFEKKQDE